MNQIPVPSTFIPRQVMVLQRLREHLERHGNSLDALLRQIRADPEAAESDTLHNLSDDAGSYGQRTVLAGRLRSLVDELLAAFSEPLVEIEGGYVWPDFDAGVRWHAAHLMDIERDLRRPFAM